MTKKRTNYDILLIEPDNILANTYAKALEHSSKSVYHVASAQQAIVAVDKLIPKLIILELQLRSHNGIEFLHELRSYPDLQDIPILLLTFIPEAAIPFTVSQKRQLNIRNYLYKPQTSLDKLRSIVDEVLV